MPGGKKTVPMEDSDVQEGDQVQVLREQPPGCLFPREPMNFVRRKFSMSQEILRNMNQTIKLFDRFHVHNTIKAP